MDEVVVLIDKEISVELEIQRLHQGHEQKCDDVQGIKPREAQRKEFPAANRAIGDAVAIFPEENKAADAPEDPDAIRTVVVEDMQQAIEWQPIVDQTDRLVGDEGKVAIVKNQNGERRQEAQHLQSQELVRRSRCGWVHFEPHSADAPWSTA